MKMTGLHFASSAGCVPGAIHPQALKPGVFWQGYKKARPPCGGRAGFRLLREVLCRVFPIKTRAELQISRTGDLHTGDQQHPGNRTS